MSKPSRAPDDASWLGRRIPVTVGPIAHGGHCIARHDGRVIFVRHALPGEQVVVEVTEDRSQAYCRADAVEIVAASPDRVSPPCRYAHPGGCGGCDFQHVGIAAQRSLKAAVIEEQFQRLAQLSVSVEVEPLEPSELGWRRRVRYAVGPDGRPGLRLHRSHQVLPIDQCLIAAAPVAQPPRSGDPSPAGTEFELAVDDDGQVATLALPEVVPGNRKRPDRRSRTRSRPVQRPQLIAGPEQLAYRVRGQEFGVAAGGFWQTHPAAADAFVTTAHDQVAPQPGDQVLDLYAGAGLFTAAFAAAVTATGRVLGLEGDAAAAADGSNNVREFAWAEVRRLAVTAASVAEAGRQLGAVDAVLLDPPRTGAGRAVLEAVLALRPRVVCYVACDPAALARDVATARDAGWHLAAIRAFDAFPMTHHVECIAALRR